jgi:hypothetical protein
MLLKKKEEIFFFGLQQRIALNYLNVATNVLNR